MLRFYNVRKKKAVNIQEKDCVKHVYEQKTKEGTIRRTYGVSAVDDDGSKLNLFISESVYNSLDCRIA